MNDIDEKKKKFLEKNISARFARFAALVLLVLIAKKCQKFCLVLCSFRHKTMTKKTDGFALVSLV